MWRDIKNKWKQWFQAEESEDVPAPTPKQERHDMNAKTKMTYKYPKQGEFRFPVIPDQKTKRRQAAPSFEPTQEKQTSRRRSQRHEQEPETKEEVKDTQTSRALPETSSVPFTPTDVPSPVYGYHSREVVETVEELEDAIAATQEVQYEAVEDQDGEWEELRRRLRQRVSGKSSSFSEPALYEDKVETESESFETDDQIENTGNVEETTFDLTMDESTTVDHQVEEEEGFQEALLDEMRNGLSMEEEKVLNLDENGDVKNDATDENGVEETKDVEIEGHLEKDEEVTEPIEEASNATGGPVLEESNVEIHEEPVVPPEKKQGEQDSKREKKEKRTVPFNVIMTPRDKRTRDKASTPSTPQQKNITQKEETPQEKKVEEVEPLRVHKERIEYKTPVHLLDDAHRPSDNDDSWIEGQMELLETTLRHFHVKAKVVNAMKGPSVTRFEVQPEPGVKVSKITNLADDIKLSMAARDIRIEAPIPGKQAVGIEVPNQQSQMVGLQEIFESDAFQNDQSPLTVGLGLDIGGDPIVTNLKKMPHGLIAGATGSGKSVCINTILVSLLYKAHHDDVKFLLIDPKMVELAPYNELPHLVSPVITDVKAATTALKWAVKEMEERYEKFVEEGVRDVERYNDKMIKQQREAEKLPYLVIVIDELADLMMVSPQDVEDAICRIAQKARACGIHLLLATQRPSVDVITGLIKANIPTRIAFSVSSQVDSRTIIDAGGAEKLLGKGDMLFVENGSGQARRIQGAFVSDDEIERVTNHVKKIAPPQYLFHQEELMKQISSEEETDELFEEAVRFVLQHNGASASLIQRRFKVGYNRAARLVDQMEDFGIISEAKGSKPRDILMTEQQIEELING